MTSVFILDEVLSRLMGEEDPHPEEPPPHPSLRVFWMRSITFCDTWFKSPRPLRTSITFVLSLAFYLDDTLGTSYLDSPTFLCRLTSLPLESDSKPSSGLRRTPRPSRGTGLVALHSFCPFSSQGRRCLPSQWVGPHDRPPLWSPSTHHRRRGRTNMFNYSTTLIRYGWMVTYIVLDEP